MRLSRKQKIIIGIVLLTALCIRLIPLLPPEVRLIQHVSDDAYYLYCIADHLANGHDLSFDGVSPTTTARPLYVLLLAGLDLLFGRNLLPQLAYLFGCISDILSALLIFRFLQKNKASYLASLFGMCFYAFSAHIIFFGNNGMETPFALLALIILINLYPSSDASINKRYTLALGRGLVIAAMLLFRLDYIFLAVLAILGDFWRGIRKKHFEWLVVGGVSFLCMLPWVIWSLTTRGSLMPPSGDALTMVYKPIFGNDITGIKERIEYFYVTLFNPLKMVIHTFSYQWGTLAAMMIIVMMYVYGKLFSKSKIIIEEVIILAVAILLAILCIAYVAINIICVMTIIIIIIYIFSRYIFRDDIAKNITITILPLILGITIMTIYYGFIRLFIREWNLIEGDIFMAVFLGCSTSVLLRTNRHIYLYALVIWYACAQITLSIPAIQFGHHPAQERLYRTALWIQENTPSDTIIAAANGGILQWYSRRTLVDVAGIEDVNAYKALKTNDMYHYLKQRNVDYLVDPEYSIFKDYYNYWGVNIDEKLTEIYNSDPCQADPYEMTGFIPKVFILR